MEAPNALQDVLANLFKISLQNSEFLAQLSADVLAIKSVICALGPEANTALEEQVAVERSKIQPRIEMNQKMLELLRVSLSRIGPEN